MTVLSQALAYVLIVVDMQVGFSASHGERVRAGVRREMLAAMAAGLPIIMLECVTRHNGKTHEEFTDLFKGYDTLKYILLEKDGSGLGAGSGGGKEVREACQLLDFPTTHFRLVGVNSDICVMFTAMELDRMFRDVRLQVVKDACASISPNEWAVFEYYARDCHFKNYELV